MVGGGRAGHEPARRVFGEDPVAEQRNDDDRRQPRQQQCNGRHLEDRARVFTGRGLRERDGQEAGDRDQGTREHGKRGAGVGEGGRVQAIEPLLEFHGHGLDRDDRIVHQQPQCEDQRAQRHLVQADIEQIHQQHGAGEDQRNRNHHHHAGAGAETQQAHHQHDRNRLADRLDEVIHRVADPFGHARYFDQPEARRQGGAQPRRLRIETLAERDDVPGGRHRHPDAQSRLSRISHDVRRRLDVAAPDARDVAQPQGAAVDLQQGLAQFVDIVELAAGPDEYPVLRGAVDTGARDGVVCIDGVRDLLRRQTELGQLRIRDLDEDALLRIPEIIDLVDVRNPQQLGAHAVGVVVQLGRREAVALEHVDVGVNVTELIIEVGALYPGRQRVGDVTDLLADLVPGIGNLRRRSCILDGEEQE